MKNLPEGKAARAGVASIASAKVGARHLQSLAKRPFLSEVDKKEEKQRLEDETATILFKAFSQLRGTALKLAQMLSMESQVLPPSLQKELSKSYHQVPPLNRILVRKAMINELGSPPEEVFASFDTQAFAAASLGQVHAAQTQRGDNLAVKVQYPGIAVTIESDIRLLRGMLRTTPQAKLLLIGLEEVHQRLQEEVDYLHEASCSEWFRVNVELKGIVIPKVFPELSTTRILTTERLEGLHLEQWLETKPSQKKRDHAAQLLYDFFIHSVYELHRLHADPNPGNFLFRSDGSIGVVDFGCSRILDPRFSTALLKLFVAYHQRDREGVLDAYSSIGMLDETDSYSNKKFYEELLQPFGEWVALPLRQEIYDFSKHEGYAAQGFAFARRTLRHHRFRNMSKEFYFVDRTYHGLFQIFEKLGARVRLRHPLFEGAHKTPEFK